MLVGAEFSHPNFGWMRIGVKVAAFGYLAMALAAWLTGATEPQLLLQEVCATILLGGMVLLSRQRPALAVLVTLLTVFWELSLTIFRDREVVAVSSMVYPVLILCSGMLLGTRGAILMALASGVSVPVFVQLSGRWDEGLSNFSPERDLGPLLTFEVAVITTAILTYAVLVSYHRAHSSSEKLRRHYAGLFEAVPDGIVTMDDEGVVLEGNTAACGLLGVTRTELLGRSFVQLWSARGGVGLADRFWKVQGLQRFELNAGGQETRQVEIAVRNEEGPGARHLLVLRDVTQRVRVEERLGHAQRLESVGRLAGGVAHDFNNLLTVVSGNASLLESHADSHVRLLSRDISDASSRGAGLIRQLLAFARRDVHRPERVDLGDAVTRMSRLLDPVLGLGCSLELKAEEGASAIFDLTQLEQVVLNLVSNARDALGGRGIVRLTLRSLGGKEATRLGSTLDVEGQVMLEVADAGIGMAPEVKARLFEPFFTTKPRGHGTGLGLASVHGIVEQNGGRIHVDTAVGKGTRFRIFLPRALGRSQPVAVLPPKTVSPGLGQRILLVEDEAPVRALGVRILTRAGYHVFEASSGEAALEFLGRGQAIEMLVTDIVMPGMSGCELVATLRESRHDLPVLFVSGHVDPGAIGLEPQQRRAVEENLLPKPFSSAELLQRVGETLGRRVAN